LLAANAPDEPERVPTRQEQTEDRFGPDQFDWAQIVTSHVGSSLAQWEKNTGQPKGMGAHVFKQHAGDLFNNLQTDLFEANTGSRSFFNEINDVTSEQMQQMDVRAKEYYTTTSEGVNKMIDYALNWFGGAAGIALPKITGGGGGGGRRGPTAQDIRNQFDIEELANAVDDMSRSLVFEPHKNSKALAREYVEAIVKSKGEKKPDFATYVEGKIENTSRFKAIYKNKPASVSARQYIAPYFQQASSVARPGDAADVAIGGAQFGATAEQFRSRLAREDSVTGSAPFISNLEGRLGELNSIFKG